MTWGIARYEAKMQLRSLVFWLALALVGLMFKSELWDEPVRGAKAALTYQKDPVTYLRYWKDPEGVKTEMEERLRVGYPSETAADTWADRMQIVFAFATLFAAGFIFERDRLSKTKETLMARPLGGREYAAGKFLGAVLPVLGAGLVVLAAGIACHAYIQGMLGLSWSAMPFLRAYLVMLVPTVLYSAAVVLALTAWLPRSAVAIPVFLLYEVAGGVAPLRAKGTFDITMFIARTENLGYSVWTDAVSALVLNRVFYLLLTAVLLWLTARLLERRRAVL